ncbi:MAG: Rne/Rng family ribonuclease [Phycisphaerales bacterium]
MHEDTTDFASDDFAGTSASASDSGDTESSPSAKKKTKKKTTKKAASKTTAKKTTKKAASKKTTKKVTKKAASKKTTKKKTTKKVAAKANDEVEAPSELVEAEITETPETKAVAESEPGAEETGDSDSQPDSSEESNDDPDEDRPKKKRRRRRSRSSKSEDSPDDSQASEAGDEKPKRSSRSQPKPKTDDDEIDDGPKVDMEMVINYVPGEECRVAITEDGQLEELFAEPTDRVSRVGNIYVGKVINVEPAIQAAFVDFGCEENGFLHISDLHPQYFGEDDATERVGKKTPRRDRPPIQDALKRGQEITVAVLKEGVGTKGPTLTSYLSIPGRFLVMMPGMDKIGVSRKEEDDDRRKAAKAILGQLDLPDGFGFILRTAGFDRTKAELKRDLAYLTRLWKDMERRRKGGNRPRPLYSESDLLLRSIRDLMSTDIRRVVIDSEPALKRAAQFMKIAAPRSQAKLARYTGGAPIFHAFGIEEQIESIHAREVNLPSGGRLVIDQTEALVAIDVNSGKSRAARDAETNAYKTNLEAVDSICRQLRLRDMGGLVVCDLIDMRHSSHRKAIEQRFRDRLRRDRAKSTVGMISQFGLLEMTRQRMRGSMESQHFGDCPTCHGRGLVQNPDSVAAIALRDLAAIIDHEKVNQVELVVHPQVAGALLSTRRTALTRIELHSGKNVDVRVSESLKVDEFKFFASDHMGHDLSLEKMSGKKRPAPKVEEWRDDSSDDWAVDPSEEADETTAQKLVEEIARLAEAAGPDQNPITGSEEESESGEGTKKKRRRRRRRRGKGEASGEAESDAGDSSPTDEGKESSTDTATSESSDDTDENSDGDVVKKKRRRRRRRGRGGGESESGDHNGSSERSEQNPASTPPPEPKPAPKPESKPKRRGLYSSARRKLSPSEVARIVPE